MISDKQFLRERVVQCLFDSDYLLLLRQMWDTAYELGCSVWFMWQGRGWRARSGRDGGESSLGGGEGRVLEGEGRGNWEALRNGFSSYDFVKMSPHRA